MRSGEEGEGGARPPDPRAGGCAPGPLREAACCRPVRRCPGGRNAGGGRVPGLPRKAGHPLPAGVKGRKSPRNPASSFPHNDRQSGGGRGSRTRARVSNTELYCAFRAAALLGAVSFGSSRGAGAAPARRSPAPARPARRLLLPAAPARRHRGSRRGRGPGCRAGRRAHRAALGRLVNQMEDEGVAVPAAVRARSGPGRGVRPARRPQKAPCARVCARVCAWAGETCHCPDA